MVSRLYTWKTASLWAPVLFKSSYQATLFFLKYLFIYHRVPSLYLTIFQENGWLLISDPSFDQVKLKYQRQLNPHLSIIFQVHIPSYPHKFSHISSLHPNSPNPKYYVPTYSQSIPIQSPLNLAESDRKNTCFHSWKSAGMIPLDHQSRSVSMVDLEFRMTYIDLKTTIFERSYHPCCGGSPKNSRLVFAQRHLMSRRSGTASMTRWACFAAWTDWRVWGKIFPKLGFDRIW